MSMTCKSDNSGIYISDEYTHIKLITWEPNPTKEEDFNLEGEVKRISSDYNS